MPHPHVNEQGIGGFVPVRGVGERGIGRQYDTVSGGAADPLGVQDLREGGHACHICATMDTVLVGLVLTHGIGGQSIDR